ncbi:MAG: hypothetical protein GWM90_09800, partial [Gemmatimonadetes bacterium]|nr:hypothetical protein [Gemmatimonadota bacterium]NIQ54209.1 hypothetical protein [Gemmatimonadota bacterium]NIU74412.1 hypothetical protein [Gammaproteobacteria bacterium]NIX44398.1 hypothetical protein [Gemmatimonadota bacterium]NIY08614.1 hypothetical protein [Gemmatimonadota bacterium]
AGIRDSIATGVVNPQSYNYLNLNYAIFRILVPELWRGLPGAPSMADPPTANSSSYFYRFYVQQAIMDPIGVPLADCVQPPGTPATLFYLFGTVDGGVDPGDWSLMCGGGGYYLSAIDLVRFMVAIRYQDEILSPANRQVMDQELVGWCCNSSLTGDHGEYHSHGGALGYSSGAGMSSAIMKFPIEVEAALIINSVGGNHSNARTVLRDAFDAAW